MEVTVILLVILVILLSAFMLYREFWHVAGRVQKLEETTKEQATAIDELKNQVEKLEKANRKRMPWQALEDLEHARSALSREKEKRMFLVSLIENAEAWIEKVQTLGTKRGEK